MGSNLEENKQQYIREYYLPQHSTLPGIEKYVDICGWADYYLNGSVLFSRRKVFYDLVTFPDKLHTHGFYEIDIFFGGTVSYVSGSEIFTPHYGDIMIFPPKCEHTVHSGKDGVYDRAVLYVEREDSMMAASGYLPMIFAMLGNHAVPNYSSILQVPQKLMEIKAYIDSNYQAIPSVDHISSCFYYSREHISRLFSEYYKITPSAYLRRKKAEPARHALDLNRNVRYAFDISGFQSYSAFVKAFRELTGTTPGKYRSASDHRKISVNKDL